MIDKMTMHPAAIMPPTPASSSPEPSKHHCPKVFWQPGGGGDVAESLLAAAVDTSSAAMPGKP